MREIKRIGVLGGGAWGTALARLLDEGGRRVTLWARDAEVVASINQQHANPAYLPEIELPPTLRATDMLPELAAASDAVLLVVPAQQLRAIASELAADLRPGTPVVICAKGIERGSYALMSEVLAEVLPESPLAVLSGPTFAIEVAQGMPTAVTIACADSELGEHLVAAIGQQTFRPYLADDLVGAQIGGAVKNVMAIACGVVEGRQLGDNARAAVMTRGYAELARYGRARGARLETLLGLSGLGDLTLTCNSDLSRNMSLGILLGEGRQIEDIMAERRSVAEGMFTVSAIVDHAHDLGVDMPIATAVDGVVNYKADIERTIDNLLARPFTTEYQP
ncbi:MAG: NAD(P)H-dependent glycerol-3-phosphate dehydrogenase [Alphaproteobacteria bacterium]